MAAASASVIDAMRDQADEAARQRAPSRPLEGGDLPPRVTSRS
ncbi:MAG TPA: hypothetical protein VGI35_08785 [Steroidobacteraceae bacterium]